MTSQNGSRILLEVRDLSKSFPVKRTSLGKAKNYLKALNKVSFQITRGETLGVVGESGCGKSTLGLVILRIHEPTGGQVFFQGENIFTKSKSEFRKLRRDMQMVFQDPYASLNPRMTAGSIIGEPMTIHGLAKGREKQERIEELLNVVGLSPTHARLYPHMFSGGQRQRIGIARALAVNPMFIVLDEPVSALDVSIQSQIINLLEELQEKFNLTYMFISHDLSVIRHISDRVAVFYLGKIVELAEVDELFGNPLHPYTRALLSAIPKLDPDGARDRIVLSGDIPSPINLPDGCLFYSRCDYRKEQCRMVEPKLLAVQENHWAACYLACS